MSTRSRASAERTALDRSERAAVEDVNGNDEGMPLRRAWRCCCSNILDDDAIIFGLYCFVSYGVVLC